MIGRAFIAVAACAVVVTALPADALTTNGHQLAPGARLPSARAGAAMAFDAARGLVVLFGGEGKSDLDDTWTWDGRIWRKEHPATSPSARFGMGMAYDTARAEVVLFGGYAGGTFLGDTWTWDGTTWTKQHPAISPSAREGPAMTDDAARGEVVLFGGASGRRQLGDTWTWDGTTWTKEHPATSPAARFGMGMADDTARGKVVLFGGQRNRGLVSDTWTWDGTTSEHAAGPEDPRILNDTWTWDGTTWTKRHPATSPPNRVNTVMSYDVARDEIVLFGGLADDWLGDTWTWNGTNWMQEHPVTSPTPRCCPGIAFDAHRSEVVLFGGSGADGFLGDTWTWNGTAWRVPLPAHLHLSPDSGPPATKVNVQGTGFGAFELVTITFVDSVNGETVLGSSSTDPSGKLTAQVTVPADATVGVQKVKVVGSLSHQRATAMFTVTRSSVYGFRGQIAERRIYDRNDDDA